MLPHFGRRLEQIGPYFSSNRAYESAPSLGPTPVPILTSVTTALTALGIPSGPLRGRCAALSHQGCRPPQPTFSLEKRICQPNVPGWRGGSPKPSLGLLGSQLGRITDLPELALCPWDGSLSRTIGQQSLDIEVAGWSRMPRVEVFLAERRTKEEPRR
jgi:hypothetical protein